MAQENAQWGEARSGGQHAAGKLSSGRELTHLRTELFKLRGKSGCFGRAAARFRRLTDEEHTRKHHAYDARKRQFSEKQDVP